ncbi:hypothetical protein [Candidatus Nitronereus thalassa]|uniref:Uncharacterized protein n=1 Tax=Candidatus Nitronereus thalassa TaxID=3020898 RepID=A0ABU3K5C9_9BACT|nr:hypothetical protein [Candidatus Nitronereus thalassa]MDT7041611.1 hypothetical protein [Candidatus Nitronereus thalassa]
MRRRNFGVPALSLIGGFVGAAMFHLVIAGVNVEAEESQRNLVADSISVKHLTLYNQKNEVVANLSSDSFGLPMFSMGRNELNRIDLSFRTENQPAIKVTGGMGKSFSVMSVRNQGPYWEPMIGLGHKNQEEGVLMSIFNNTGNLILTNNHGEALRFEASQGNTWRKVLFQPSTSPSIRSMPSNRSVPYSNVMNR